MSSVDVAVPTTSAPLSTPKQNAVSDNVAQLPHVAKQGSPAEPAPAAAATSTKGDATSHSVAPAVAPSAQPTDDSIVQGKGLAPPEDSAVVPTGISPSGTVLPPGPTCIPTDTDQTLPTGQGALREDRSDENALEAAVDEAAEIASDVQERSQVSDLDETNSIHFDEDEPGPVPTTALEATGALEPNHNQSVQPLDSVAQNVSSPVRKPTNQEETADGDKNTGDNKAPAIDPQSADVPGPTTDGPSVILVSTQPEAQEADATSGPSLDAPTEPPTSYTSPNHEWARILQRRLGRGLTDAQLLARSNSMLASPSILAQSLTQVIPSLQVKDNTASPGSSTREYQTAEELFDRPPVIEPSAHVFNYDDQPKDEAFPSSTFVNGSQAQLLLFAPLDPGQLYGKSKTQPTAPSAPAEGSSTKQSQSTSSAQPQQQQQPISAAPNAAQQPVQVAPPPIPIPLPPIAGAPSPASRAPPLAQEVRQSPLLSREQATGTKNARQSLVLLAPSQEEKPKALLGQASSSSLLGTPISTVIKDHHVTGTPNPIAPIQYTPVTQYKANPSKEGSKHNKKARDMSASVTKDGASIVESPVPLKASVDKESVEAKESIEVKESVIVAPASSETEVTAPAAINNAEPAPAALTSMPEILAPEASPVDPIAETKAPPPLVSEGTALWALEALSGLSNVEFDATMPVCAAVATTLSATEPSKEAAVKAPMALPPISTGSRSNTSTTESPRVAKMIPSPFERTQILQHEETQTNQQGTTPELGSQKAPSVVDALQGEWVVVPAPPPPTPPPTAAVPLPVPVPVPATVVATGIAVYPGSFQSASNIPSNQPSFDSTPGTTMYQYRAPGMHSANRSISSLRDVQVHNSTMERSSLDYNYLRRAETAPTMESSYPSSTPTAPSPFTLGSGYQIPWLPQSRPLLPPRADVNSIDVPALTGRQLLPMEPRKQELDTNDSCLQFKHIGEAIRHWGLHTPEGNAFANLDGKGVECASWDWSFALGRAEMIAKAIHDKTQLRTRARVALVFRLSEILEFVAAFYGAILAGVVPVIVNQIQDFSEMVYIMTSAKVELALTTQFNHRSLQKDLKKGSAWPSGVTWWQTDILETWAPKNGQEERPALSNCDLAYIEYTKSTAGELKGVAVSHKSLITQCQALYTSFNWRPALYRDKNGNWQTDPQLASDAIPPQMKERKKIPPRLPGTTMTWLEPRQQSGLILGLIMGAFTGNFTVFMDSSITAISGLWAHSIAAYRANIAFADYIGVRKLLHNYRVNPQGTVTPTRPDLRFLQTVYVDAQSNNSVLNREFLDDYLYPLGMIARHSPPPKGSMPPTEEAPTVETSVSKMVRSDLGVIAFLSLMEHGGMILCLRDPLEPPAGADKSDVRKLYRKSATPMPRRQSEVSREGNATSSGAQKPAENLSQAVGADQGISNDKTDNGPTSHPATSFSCGEYLLHRGALRSNRISILATGDEAVKRKDESGTILVSAFGYPMVDSTVMVVDPETLALSLPNVVGELWVSSPGMPVGFWGLPEHTQEVFNADAYIVSEENMIATVYRPPGCEKLLRTGLLGAVIEGRIVVFGTYWDRLQQDIADPMKPLGVEYDYHHCSDLKNTLFSNVGGIGDISIFECLVNNEYMPIVCIELTRDSRWNGQSMNTVAQHVAINSRHVLQDVNGLRSYCMAVWDVNTLPRIFENGRRIIDHALTKKMFELGRIYKMLYFATFTDDVVFNVPRGDDTVNGFWSRECAITRQRRQGAVRYVQYTSNITNPDAHDELLNVPMGKFHNITDVLIWRTHTQPEDIAFVELDSRGKEQKSIGFKKFNQKVTGYAMHLEKKHGLKAGDHVLLWFSQDLDYVITLHACWVLGLIPIPLPLPDNISTNQQGNTIPSHFSGGHGASGSMMGLGAGLNSPFTASPATVPGTQPTNPVLSTKATEDRRNAILRALFRIMDEVKVKAILGNSVTDDFLKHKTTSSHLRASRSTFTTCYSQTTEVFSSPDVVLPTFYNVSKAAKTKQILGALSGYAPRKEWFNANHPAVYLIDPDAMTGTVGSNKLLKLNHETLNNLCRNQKLQFKMLNGHPVISAMSIFHGLGFVHGCLCGIYNGGASIVLQPVDFATNPTIWLEIVARYKAQDVALTYPLLDQLLARLDGTNGQLSSQGMSLETVKNLMICGHGRIQMEKSMTAMARLGPLKLEAGAINLVYSHPLNPMVTTQAERAAGTVRIYVSSKNLRYGLVTTTTEGDDPTGIWLEDTGVTTVCTSIAIVHPETFEVCAGNQIGEVWVCSDSSITSFHVPAGHTNSPSHPQPFNACITGYDPRVRYVRTGDLGFLWNGQQQQQQVLQRQQSILGRNQASHAGSGSFQLFILGRLDESFQVHGLLHFSADVEATVEGSHANVSNQGCVTFKSPLGQVVCVVKVQSQEPELLVSMYIPIMHAILEQHQFLPDTIVLVGDNVSTARRLVDGLKPRGAISNLYTSERLPILHLHHCHGKPLPPVPSSLLPPIHDRGVLDLPTSAPTSGGRNVHPYSQPQPSITYSQQSLTGSTGNRVLTNISSAPMLTSVRAPPHMNATGFSNGSSEAAAFGHGSNRNSIYGSPLLVANIPLPPGAHNPLLQSPPGNIPTSGAGYQPQTQYQPGYIPSTSAAPVLSVSTGTSVSTIPQPLSAPSHGPSSGLSAGNVQRPMSQQGFVSNSSTHSGSSSNGAAAGPSNHDIIAQTLLNEMSMYGASSERTRGSSRSTPQPLQQQQSQPQLQRPAHPGRLQSQESRSLSSDELRVDSSKTGAVKNLMKGMNAKWSEIRKTGIN
ncbi:hypothetical protein B0O80DRAFT_489031 [Mortierella sp. GBAus27b]|nr:hypothetical protein BGX31_011155 [Mortierella sp. GBA43]KAI8350544.1 hypothetical protein B0O80DRAFT_489031 [Mortierella sp. GBAus27b]